MQETAHPALTELYVTEQTQRTRPALVWMLTATAEMKPALWATPMDGETSKEKPVLPAMTELPAGGQTIGVFCASAWI